MGRLQALVNADALDTGLKRVRVDVIGKSVKGKEIPLVTVADPNAPEDSARKLFIICRQHGDEPATTEAMLDLIDELARKTDQTTTDLLSRVSFHIVPMMNPDGADRHIRRNANSVDLNRDWITLSQPETLAVRAAIDSVRPDVIIDAHELSPTNGKSDFIESAGPSSGASPQVIAESENLQQLVIGILRTHDIAVKSFRITDTNPARLAHRYFPIHAGTITLLLETRQAGIRQYQLQYRKRLHYVGTLTVAKYLAGQGEELARRVAEHDAAKWRELASRKRKPNAGDE